MQSGTKEIRPLNGSTRSVVEVCGVMHCLDEAETIASCVHEAMVAFKCAGIDGEVLIADNGSTEGSQEIARRSGA